MANILHFMIPADNLDRARHFYAGLLGWKIKPATDSADPALIAEMQYHDIVTGPAMPGTLNSGGLYKRHMNEPILNFVMVEDIDKVLSKVEELGGKVLMPKMEIKGVGLNAMIQDSEGNTIGIWKPQM